MPACTHVHLAQANSYPGLTLSLLWSENTFDVLHLTPCVVICHWVHWDYKGPWGQLDRIQLRHLETYRPDIPLILDLLPFRRLSAVVDLLRSKIDINKSKWVSHQVRVTLTQRNHHWMWVALLPWKQGAPWHHWLQLRHLIIRLLGWWWMWTMMDNVNNSHCGVHGFLSLILVLPLRKEIHHIHWIRKFQIRI